MIPTVLILFMLLPIAGCSPYQPLQLPVSETRAKDAFYYKDRLGRGINLSDALEAPHEGDWGIVLQDFQLIKDAGFHSVRIPIRWSSHAQDVYPYTIQETFFQRVDWAIQQALSRQLVAVINMHHYDEMMQNPRVHHVRLAHLWKQIAEHYQDYPDSLYFEILGEPSRNLTDFLWNAYIPNILQSIRETNPNRIVIIPPAGWGNIPHLESLQLPEKDRNIIVTFHYYAPFRFTHQGAKWINVPSIENTLGVQWKGSNSEKHDIRQELKAAARWSKRHNRPLYMGEFGAYHKADMDSRVRWTAFVVRTAERWGFAWAYWEFGAGFGAYDRQAKRWRSPLLQALIPTPDI